MITVSAIIRLCKVNKLWVVFASSFLLPHHRKSFHLIKENQSGGFTLLSYGLKRRQNPSKIYSDDHVIFTTESLSYPGKIIKKHKSENQPLQRISITAKR